METKKPALGGLGVGMHWTSVVGMALAPIAGMALPHVTAWIRKLDSELLERHPWLMLRKRPVTATYVYVEPLRARALPQPEDIEPLDR